MSYIGLPFDGIDPLNIHMTLQDKTLTDSEIKSFLTYAPLWSGSRKASWLGFWKCSLVLISKQRIVRQ